jgi:DNA-binding response OmpR family regulator
MVKVLVIDDEPAYRDSLRLLMPCEGFEVETAANAQEAFDVADRFRPDVLIVDWMLKDRTDGLDIAEKLRGSLEHLRVIVITGYPTATLEARIRNSPATQFLTKPFTLSDLIDAIYAAVESPT